MTYKTILERLDDGEVIVGDGSYVITLEKRGYVKAGNWTPEACIENPRAVEQLALDYARAGADVTQTFTYYSRDVGLPDYCNLTYQQINQAACDIARTVAEEKGTLVAGAVTHTAVFKQTRDKMEVHKELAESFKTIVENDVDFLIVEYFEFLEEMEWAIEHCLSYGKPVAATMCIGPKGDHDGVSAGECAVRMARAGARILGINCCFDPPTSMETLTIMKQALDKAGLHPHLMAQPNAFKAPDGGIFGWINLPEFPYACEPRLITRFEVQAWAREAYNLGVRYIGGCCGFEPYHIRAIAEELAEERGKLPEGSRQSDHDLSVHRRKGGCCGFEPYHIRAIAEELAEERGKLPEGSHQSDHDLSVHRRKGELGRPEFRDKGRKEFWMNLAPATGRPLSTAFYRQTNPQLVNKSVLK